MSLADQSTVLACKATILAWYDTHLAWNQALPLSRNNSSVKNDCVRRGVPGSRLVVTSLHGYAYGFSDFPLVIRFYDIIQTLRSHRACTC